MKYTIDYGFGIATLYTPFDPKSRFYTLANTCFGIRKSIAYCRILRAEKVECSDFERLEFSGDVYVWDNLGRRKMLEPWPDEDWDPYYIETCKPPQNA
jgi:hypothetical protein